jgi:hypothetical protein
MNMTGYNPGIQKFFFMHTYYKKLANILMIHLIKFLASIQNILCFESKSYWKKFFLSYASDFGIIYYSERYSTRLFCFV